jgi:hypothetical protein
MMEEKKLDYLIQKSFSQTVPEINLHGPVMDQVELYEKKKITRSYLCEIIVSSLLIFLSIVSLIFVNWYFSMYSSVFQLFPLSSGIMKLLSIGIFLLILVVVTALDIRMMYVMLKERAR